MNTLRIYKEIKDFYSMVEILQREISYKRENKNTLNTLENTKDFYYMKENILRHEWRPMPFLLLFSLFYRPLFMMSLLVARYVSSFAFLLARWLYGLPWSVPSLISKLPWEVRHLRPASFVFMDMSTHFIYVNLIFTFSNTKFLYVSVRNLEENLFS